VLEAAFSRARYEKRLAFIPYVMAGDPDLRTSELLLRTLSEAGADVIELGVPYSDPLADGPTIAAAGQRALAAGVGIAETLELARRCAGNCAPILLFTYYNPIYQYGMERFAGDAAEAGAAGAIVPDVPLEEAAELSAALAAHGLAMPLLVAPSTPSERAARIVGAATGFVYVVSRLGVTGAGSAPSFERLRGQLTSLRAMTDKPLAVGFGVSRAEDARAVAGFADAIVVGSALIDRYAGFRGDDVVRRVRRFVEPLISALAADGA
jgi:tryptophan synthase alpha chain